MFKKLIWVFVLVFSIRLSALDEKLINRIEEADQFLFSRNMEEAFKNYQEVYDVLKQDKKLSTSDKIIFEEMERSIKELDFYIKIQPIYQLLNQIPELEDEKAYQKEWEIYKQIEQMALDSKIGLVSYLEGLSGQGLASQIILRKVEVLKKVSARFLDKLEKDKKRKKIVSFLGFQKDPKINFNIEEFIGNIIFQTVSAESRFIYQESSKSGSMNKMFLKARESGVDLVLSGKYKSLPKERILFTLFVIDPFVSEKKLIEIRVETKMGFEIFDAVEKMINDALSRLKNYSRLEGFDAVSFYQKDDGKVETSIKKETTEKNEKKDLILYLQQKMDELENKIRDEKIFEIKSILQENQNLKNFHDAGEIILRFNQQSYQKKIPYKDFILKHKKEIRKLILNESEIKRLEEKAEKNWEQGFYGNALEEIEGAEKVLKRMRERYTGIKDIIVEIEKIQNFKWDERKNNLENQLNIALKWKKNLYFGLSYQFEKTYMTNEDIVLLSADKLSGNFGGLFLFRSDLAGNDLFFNVELCYYLVRKANLSYSGQSYGEIQNNTDIDALLGIDYTFSVFSFLDAGVNVFGGVNYSRITNLTNSVSTHLEGFGYKVSGGIFFEFLLYLPVRLQVLYDLGETGSLKHDGVRLEFMGRIIGF
ncbi:MAG TPA: hypothetical protein DHW82_06480 [Spirochaetia bacterium]|nr:hypothetical protein [Spirochaetia bacterium]